MTPSTRNPNPEPDDDGLPLLQSGCAALGVPLSDEQIHQFATYHRLLVEWNERFNLTAITESREVQVRHFLDCIAGWPPIVEEMGGEKAHNRSWHLADVGSGAGFPGIPLKIVAPRLKVALIDGTGKKVQFLRHVAEALGLANTAVVQGRAEELGQQPAYRGQFDIVTARAVAPLATLAEYLLPLVRSDGYAAIYKGAQAAQEFIEARKAIEILGGEAARMTPLAVPYLEETRFLILLRKVKPTPSPYPRGQGLARKNPLD